MGQKVNPTGFRTGITLGWKSRWFAPKSNFGEFLVEDEKLRQYVDKTLNRQPPYAGISTIEIERTREEVKIILKTARPGLVIGPKGAEVDKLREELENLVDRKITVNIVEIKNPKTADLMRPIEKSLRVRYFSMFATKVPGSTPSVSTATNHAPAMPTQL